MSFVKRISVMLATVVAGLLLTFAPVSLVNAAEYNCGAYGSGVYDSSAACGSSSDLSNTGMNVWLIRILAVVLIAGGITLAVTATKKKKRAKDNE